jgi:5-carboxymethyl-2-hydroxymuconate isomerase
MPHITIEFSDGAAARADIRATVDAVHRVALDSGVFPVGGIRTLARISPCSSVFDGAERNSFVQIDIRVAPGRSTEVKQAVLRDILAAAEAALAPLFAHGPTGLQVEMSEFDAPMRVSRNTALP